MFLHSLFTSQSLQSNVVLFSAYKEFSGLGTELKDGLLHQLTLVCPASHLAGSWAVLLVAWVTRPQITQDKLHWWTEGHVGIPTFSPHPPMPSPSGHPPSLSWLVRCLKQDDTGYLDKCKTSKESPFLILIFRLLHRLNETSRSNILERGNGHLFLFSCN